MALEPSLQVMLIDFEGELYAMLMPLLGALERAEP